MRNLRRKKSSFMRNDFSIPLETLIKKEKLISLKVLNGV